MIVRDIKRLLLFLIPFLILLYTGFSFYKEPTALPSKVNGWIQPVLNRPPSDTDLSAGSNAGSSTEPGADSKPELIATPNTDATPDSNTEQSKGHAGHLKEEPASSGLSGWFGGFGGFHSDDTKQAVDNGPITHHEIFGSSTLDKKFFSIDFGGKADGINPNIIPHPVSENTWIVVAQQARGPDDQTPYFVELVCDATFQNGVLKCLKPATALPVEPTKGEKCEGDLSYFNVNVGPHDARVLWGPDKPFIVYGTNSQFTCFGQNIQDFRKLVNWPSDTFGNQDFAEGTELQRPKPWGTIEKNWFPFWDTNGQMYAHYDIAPKRVFAKINPDGSSGEDLAPLAATQDETCLAKYMPKLPEKFESIHQATNSLRITMCRRTDPGCAPDESNTFIFTIWQHKTFYNFHGVYEPYAMLFQEQAPFAVHAISKKPIWIHGRQQYIDRGTSDMFYVTSINWKHPMARYHGYLDDELFLGFGIEDHHSGGIDLTAADLLSELGLCTEN